ncbi:MAG: hypothetical protein DRI79_02090 [Chloroflexi bacterium]|nr:MAG: hypothetical protein DRI79_02090 [Chloroflexota bacterium]
MSSLEEWCGAHSKCRRFWEGHSEFLPKAEKPPGELKIKELRKLLQRWENWWKEEECADIQPTWEKLWRGLNADAQRYLVEQACHRSYIKETDTDLWRSLRENRLLIELTRNGKTEGRVIGAFSFWLYYYKRRGRVKRWWVKLTEAPRVVISSLLEEAHKRAISPKGQARIFIALSWVLVPVLFIAASGVSVKQLPEILGIAAVGNTLLQWRKTLADYRYLVEVLIALVIALLAGIIWFCFVERSVEHNHVSTGWKLVRRIAYSIPAAVFLLTLFLSPGQMSLSARCLTIAALCALLAYLLFALPLATYSDGSGLERLVPWEWLRFLLLIIPFLGILLLSHHISDTIPGLISGWLCLLSGSFLSLRLWWKALDWLDESRQQAKRRVPASGEVAGSQNKREEKDEDKDKKYEGPDPWRRIWEALLGFYHRYPAEAFPTLLVILSLLLVHLLWFRLQIMPITHRVPASDETRKPDFSVFITAPPWLSTEDRGDVIINVTNHLTSTLALTVTLAVTSTGETPGAEVMYLLDREEDATNGQIFFKVPAQAQASESLTLVTLPLHNRLYVSNLPLQITMQGNHTPVEPLQISVPILSSFLPAMYASSRTFLGAIFRLAWAIAQVSTAVLFASRGGGK